MADAFYAALRRQGIAGSWDHASTFEQAWGDAPITEVDRLVG
jgi:hypothetical protein